MGVIRTSPVPDAPAPGVAKLFNDLRPRVLQPRPYLDLNRDLFRKHNHVKGPVPEAWILSPIHFERRLRAVSEGVADACSRRVLLKTATIDNDAGACQVVDILERWCARSPQFVHQRSGGLDAGGCLVAHIPEPDL